MNRVLANRNVKSELVSWWISLQRIGYVQENVIACFSVEIGWGISKTFLTWSSKMSSSISSSFWFCSQARLIWSMSCWRLCEQVGSLVGMMLETSIRWTWELVLVAMHKASNPLSRILFSLRSTRYKSSLSIKQSAMAMAPVVEDKI